MTAAPETGADSPERKMDPYGRRQRVTLQLVFNIELQAMLSKTTGSCSHMHFVFALQRCSFVFLGVPSYSSFVYKALQVEIDNKEH
jgi:hypothetical protein